MRRRSESSSTVWELRSKNFEYLLPAGLRGSIRFFTTSPQAQRRVNGTVHRPKAAVQEGTRTTASSLSAEQAEKLVERLFWTLHEARVIRRILVFSSSRLDGA